MIKISQITDCYLTIEFTSQIRANLLDVIVAFEQALKNEVAQHVRETVPAYTTLTVYYYPQNIKTLKIVEAKCEQLIAIFNSKKYKESATKTSQKPIKIIEILVDYGGENGPDLQLIADYCKMTIAQVIKLHSSTLYTVSMTGFLPGFIYMSGMSESLTIPRRKTPRALVEAGSIALADQQTGIYGINSPGGWQIIGKTNHKLIDWKQQKPFIINAGDVVKFIAK